MDRRYVDQDGLIFDPDEMRQRQEELGIDWADKHAAASLLEETEKALLSEISIHYRSTVDDVRSDIAAERMARASVQYRDHIRKMVEARRVANRARAAYDAYRAFVELRRTQMANERALATMR